MVASLASRFESPPRKSTRRAVATSAQKKGYQRTAKRFSNVGQVVFADLSWKATGPDVTPGNHVEGGAEGREAGDKVVAVGPLGLRSGAALQISSEPAPAVPVPRANDNALA